MLAQNLHCEPQNSLAYQTEHWQYKILEIPFYVSELLIFSTEFCSSFMNDQNNMEASTHHTFYVTRSSVSIGQFCNLLTRFPVKYVAHKFMIYGCNVYQLL